MAQKRRPVNLSASKIRKEDPGEHLSTVGSAWVLELPLDIAGTEPHHQATASRSEKKRKTFLVTTSQVVTKNDVSSQAACEAAFLPVGWGSTKAFGLNNVPCRDVLIRGQTNEEMSLILIPTEPLHKQRFLSIMRRNEFQLDRAQLCHRCKESQNPEEAEDEPGRRYCYVMCENAAENDKSFRLRSYVLETEADGSFFLQPTGNKAKLRKLEDFDRTENPKGSIILNENGQAVGFLAFGKNDKIHPLFLPQNLQGMLSISIGLVHTTRTLEMWFPVCQDRLAASADTI